jgi:hypothetical protein
MTARVVTARRSSGFDRDPSCTSIPELSDPALDADTTSPAVEDHDRIIVIRRPESAEGALQLTNQEAASLAVASSGHDSGKRQSFDVDTGLVAPHATATDVTTMTSIALTYNVTTAANLTGVTSTISSPADHDKKGSGRSVDAPVISLPSAESVGKSVDNVPPIGITASEATLSAGWM